ncbi:protein rep [Pseudomonas putida]|uniref:protein rep n=1 Tax=Pseudomonas putida TaxID=303 RepID=UPI0018E67A15|nr:protein rep [Pseudomonas putida]MBI6945257.1 protein rep [Pseudomonas putida]MBI6961572.1 protein rep [Pseudomonas putida]
MSNAPTVERKSQGRADPLGKYTKSATPPLSKETQNKLRATRAERYELLAAARGLFLFQGKQERLEHPHDWHRTAKCKWVSVAGAVGVHASCEHNSAFFSGLMNCGSVWSCPVCAAKVQERRREEIAKAIAWTYAEKLQPVMVTLTFPHYAWQKLAELVEQQADALHRLRAGAPWKRFKESVGYQGLIRSLELTLGLNGWHPHTHELWLVASWVDAEAMKAKVLERWKNCCARAGLLDLANAEQVAAFEAHAVDVKGWCDASDYLAKQDDSRHWGADRELAKGSTKVGRAKGKHPFGLLAAASVGDKQAGAKYIEYASVMKGKRQLYWSSGLKTRVGLVDRTDEELAEEERDSAEMLGLLDLSDWKLVREAGKRAQLLDAAESGGWPAVLALIRSLARQKIPQALPEPFG